MIGRAFDDIADLENLHLMVILQESLGIENHEIHPFISFVHRSSGDFLHGIESTPEIIFVYSLLRENNNSNLFDISSRWPNSERQ
jgi:hypothetical protein